MMKIYEFDAEIKKREGMDAAFVEIPFDVEREFGTRGQVKVIAEFDGHEYRGSLAKMGHPCHMLGLTKKVREAIGKQPGDTVSVKLQQDDQSRIVEVPPDLKSLLESAPEVKEFFEKLSYTHQKEYVRWISEAKKEETRSRRLHKTMELLRKKIKHP